MSKAIAFSAALNRAHTTKDRPKAVFLLL